MDPKYTVRERDGNVVMKNRSEETIKVTFFEGDRTNLIKIDPNEEVIICKMTVEFA